jgi:23S rRNA pseudouridine1911/1915/1917 synthase
MSINVLYEDNHLIGVYKPAGMLVQGDISKDASLLDEVKDYIRKKYNKQGNVFLGLIHRLDRNVAGVVLLGKTTKGASRLSEQFRLHTVEKIYHAWVEGDINEKQGTLVHFLARNEANNKVLVSESEQPDYDRAELSYEVVERVSEFNKTLVKIRLKTGRHHQIRAQFSYIGHPIQGDTKYGATTKFTDMHISLYATELSFVTATGDERKTLSIPVPRD